MKQVEVMKKNTIRIFEIITFLLVVNVNIYSQNQDGRWMKYKSPEEVGWPIDSLENIKEKCEEWNVAAMMIVYKGNILFSYGDISRRFDCASMRKSLLNSLYGIYIDNGIIDIHKSLKDISINDKTELTENEKEATIESLLKSQSGVYLKAVGETSSMQKNRPTRGSYPPDTHFFFNNWDFNCLATIFMNETKMDLYSEFLNKIAVPLGMEDFRAIDGCYNYDSLYSYHPQYPFKMSARDLARFGLLYQKNGSWKNKQIISPEWITQSTQPYYSDNYWGYGYLWWTCNYIDSTIYEASGMGGQKVVIIPDREVVLVILNNTYKKYEKHRDFEFIKLIQSAQYSFFSKNPELIPLELEYNDKLNQSIEIENLKKYAQNFEYDNEIREIIYTSEGLIYKDFFQYRLIPLSTTEFFAEDINQIVTFKIESDGKPIVSDIRFIE